MPTKLNILSWALHNPEDSQPDSHSFAAYFQLFSEYEKKLNLSFTKIGLSGKGYHENKIFNYSAGIKKLDLNKFQNLTSITLYTSKHDGQDFAFDWETLFSVSWHKSFGTHLYAGVDTACLANRADTFTELIVTACKLIKPILAYSYVSSPAEGPFAYSAGSIHTPQNDYLTEERKDLILAWSRERDTITSGKIRDLYPEMILSPVHLLFAIEDKPLREWISSDPQRGVLKLLSNQNTYWKIPRASYHAIRDTLAKAGMLIAYDKNIVPTVLY